MTQEELDALIAEHGGPPSRTMTGPADEPDPDTDGRTKRAIPASRRPTKIVFKDGSTIVLRGNASDDGEAGTDTDGNEFTVVTPLAAKKDPAGTGTNSRLDGQGNLFQFDKDKGWIAVEGAGPKVSPEEAEEKRQLAIEHKKQREYNSTHPDANGNAYYATHDEVAKLKDDAIARGLTAEQIKLANERLVTDNRRLDNAEAQQTHNNQVTDAREERMTRAAEDSSKAQAAAAALATQRLSWDKEVEAGRLSADAAKEAYRKEYDAVQALAVAARLSHDQATERNRVDDSKRDDATVRRNQDLVHGDNVTRDTETNRANRNDEAQDMVDSASKSGEAAARIATDSLPFMAPKGTAQQFADMRNNLLTDPQHPQAERAVPAMDFPWDPTTLVHDLTAKALEQHSAFAKQVVSQSAAPPSVPGSATPAPAPAPAAPAPAAAAPSPPAGVGTATSTAAGAGAAAGANKGTVINLHFNAPMGTPQQVTDSNTAPQQRGLLGG